MAQHTITKKISACLLRFEALSLTSSHYVAICPFHWATDKIKSKYNGCLSLQNPWDSHCFDTAYTQTLLRFILAVTGLQRKPKYCHIWDPSPRDHALWPTREPMAKKSALGCLVSVYLIAFFLFSALHGSLDPLCMYVASPPNLFCVNGVDPPLLLLPSVISPLWSHLLLKPVAHPSSICSPNPELQAESKPQDPCPHRRSWIMYAAFSEKKASLWPT